MGHNQSSHNGGDPEVTVFAKMEWLEVVVRWECGWRKLRLLGWWLVGIWRLEERGRVRLSRCTTTHLLHDSSEH